MLRNFLKKLQKRLAFIMNVCYNIAYADDSLTFSGGFLNDRY